MNLSFISKRTWIPRKSNQVLIEKQPDGTFKATLLALPNYQGLGSSKEEALNDLKLLFQERQPEIVTLEIEPPLMEFAGISNNEGNAWDVLEALTGTIAAPSDWSSQHNHYLYRTHKYH